MSSLLLSTAHTFPVLQHGVPPLGCSSFREYHPVFHHGSLCRLQFGQLLHCGLSHAHNCSRSGEAVEVIEHLRLLVILGAEAGLFILQKYLDLTDKIEKLFLLPLFFFVFRELNWVLLPFIQHHSWYFGCCRIKNIFYINSPC